MSASTKPRLQLALDNTDLAEAFRTGRDRFLMSSGIPL